MNRQKQFSSKLEKNNNKPRISCQGPIRVKCLSVSTLSLSVCFCSFYTDLVFLLLLLLLFFVLVLFCFFNLLIWPTLWKPKYSKPLQQRLPSQKETTTLKLTTTAVTSLVADDDERVNDAEEEEESSCPLAISSLPCRMRDVMANACAMGTSSPGSKLMLMSRSCWSHLASGGWKAAGGGTL